MICPEFFGCSGKLGYRSTRDLLQGAGVTAVGDFSTSRDGHYAMSVDRVSRCSSDNRLFAEIAMTHVCRDLEAALSPPTDAMICYEFGSECDEQARVELVREVNRAANERGILVGKCHSVVVDGVTSLVICVAGPRQQSPSATLKYGSLWLSHPLGAAKLAYMGEIGRLQPPASAMRLMSSAVQTSVLRKFPSAIADVSGHGLAGTLLDFAERYDLTIDAALDQTCALSPEVISEQISLLENEWSSYGAAIEAHRNAIGLAALKETAGPLVALVSADDPMSGALLSDADWLMIGRFEQGPSKVTIQWNA